MNMDDLIDHAKTLDAVLILRPRPGDGSPEVSWGDAFIYYAPDGVIPATQPFATIVTKDYPDEPASGLDQPGAFRLNIAAPKAEFARVIGSSPRDVMSADHDAHARDTWFPHPVYGAAGWLSVVNPATRLPEALSLLDAAHQAARDRHRRRTA
ncbi:hypothetical protein FDA94_04590 [Herbidospora galbida]|uniref:DUF6194 domain-containing protein n=1 Tax=Herbidospora galbida TaxID=2575442 RepID=A0A4V5V054_9ACTN|nr:DUF6194 family protein [Herbidospora galbida]TKK91033.1 hypothetical protein FDA94_04590 [Herbidospora galbida]